MRSKTFLDVDQARAAAERLAGERRSEGKTQTGRPDHEAGPSSR